MVRVEPATPDMFEAVYPLLQGFPNQSLPKEGWRRMLFDPPWPIEGPQRGLVLRDGGEIVGFLGTLFSTRWVRGERHRFCNLSSWIVRESHRGSSMMLVLPVLAMNTHTLVNLTPSEVAHRIFVRLGFQTLEDRQWLIAPFASPERLLPALGVRVTTRLDEIRERLDPAGQEILDHMRGTAAVQLLLSRGDRMSHVIVTRSLWKGRWRLAHVQYASDWDLLWNHPLPATWASFLSAGTVGLRIDHRHAAGRKPRLGVQKRLALPTLYRPAGPEITPDLVDGLYSELVCQPW